MLGVWVAAAEAAEVRGELFGRPFRPKTALGLTDPRAPGVLVVMLSAERATCAEVAAARAEGGRPPEKAVVLATFNDVRDGALADALLVVGPAGLGAMVGTATLQTAARAEGEVGVVVLALTPDPAGREGMLASVTTGAPTDQVAGAVSFTMCSGITPV
jgi:hypothetical protein